MTDSDMFRQLGSLLGSRFEGYVTLAGPDDCWLWHGAINPRGYGVFNIDKRSMNASRAAWLLEYGPIPEGRGLQVLHACDTPLCVNPGHLMLGTQRANVVDMNGKGRRVQGLYRKRLSEADVVRVRRLAALGWTHDELAIRFGMSRQGIGALVRRTRRAA